MRPFIVLFAFLVAVVPALAQTGPGDIEASFSGALQSLSSGGSNASTNILVSARVGFFPVNGLEIEPEFTVVKPDEGDMLYIMSANFAYNFELPNAGARPFILAGYGVSNSLPIFGMPLGNLDDAVGVLNLGAGIKVPVLETAFLRVEYRFQKFSGKQTDTFFGTSYTTDVDVQYHTIQFGLSVIF